VVCCVAVERIPRPRLPLPEDPQSVARQRTDRNHPHYRAVRAVCDAYRNAIAEREKEERTAAMVARLNRDKAAKSRRSATPSATRSNTATLPPPPHLVRDHTPLPPSAPVQSTAPVATSDPAPCVVRCVVCCAVACVQPANANSPTYRFPRRIAYDTTDFEDTARPGARGDTFYRPYARPPPCQVIAHPDTADLLLRGLSCLLAV
jgi:hypothetical protein